MKFAVITIFPEMFKALSEQGVIARAIKAQRIELTYFNPRDFTLDKHRCVDDRPFGGGPGMVMMAEPLANAIESAKSQLGDTTPVFYLSPQGQVVSQSKLQQFSTFQSAILIAGRYEGIDERVIETLVDEELSIGDYVLSGGELPAMVLIDGISRLIPGVLGDSESAENDSFSNELLDHPHYTRPSEWRGHKVPEALLSGDHKAINAWRLQQAKQKTTLRNQQKLNSQPSTDNRLNESC